MGRLFKEAKASKPKMVNASDLASTYSTASRPVLLRCDDGNQYVVKGKDTQRQMLNDQIVPRLGAAIDAPVGEVCLVDVLRN